VQNADGSKRDSWGPVAIRIADLAVTPDQTRIVAVGLIRAPNPTSASAASGDASRPVTNGSTLDHRMVIFDLVDKREEM
jgi:WD repeat-containing protein 26